MGNCGVILVCFVFFKREVLVVKNNLYLHIPDLVFEFFHNQRGKCCERFPFLFVLLGSYESIK